MVMNKMVTQFNDRWTKSRLLIGYAPPPKGLTFPHPQSYESVTIRQSGPRQGCDPPPQLPTPGANAKGRRRRGRWRPAVGFIINGNPWGKYPTLQLLDRFKTRDKWHPKSRFPGENETGPKFSGKYYLVKVEAKTQNTRQFFPAPFYRLAP